MPAASGIPPGASTSRGRRIALIEASWHRALVGLALAALVALAARRAGALGRSGAAAATVVGAIACAAGWGWAALLIAYFVLATALTRLGADGKRQRTADIVHKGGERDATQVFANGGVFAVAAFAQAVSAGESWAALGAGALAAAAADSWATEVGTLVGGTPRSMVTGRPLPTGMSGGVTLAGTAALVAGATVTALLALLFGFPRGVAAAAVAGGVAGALLDSLLGAMLQARRRCPACDMTTEQHVHTCGTPTVAAGGVAWLDNDLVNLACSAAGGLLAMMLAG